MRTITSIVATAMMMLCQAMQQPIVNTKPIAVAPANPTLRGTNIASSTASSSLLIPLPGAAVVGDFAVVAVGTQNCPNTPSGWTADNGTIGGSNWCAADYFKTLSSGDIGTGSVTVSFQGTGSQVGTIAVFVGATTGIRGSPSVNFFTGLSPASNTLTTTATPAATDGVLYVCSNRANGANTSNRGTLQQTATIGSAASASLYYEPLSTGGNFSQTCTYPGTYNPAAAAQIIILVKL